MKLVKESLNEFHKTGDVKGSLNIGSITQLKNKLKELGVPERDYNITATGIAYPNKYSSYFDNEMAKALSEFLSTEENDLLNWLKRRKSSNAQLRELIEKCLDSGSPLERIEDLIDHWGTGSERSRAKIFFKKISRTEDQERIDEENNVYIFIGYTDKTPISIGGKKYYEDKFQVENMVKIDKYNPEDLSMVEMMKLRLRFQNYQDGRVYMLTIPKDMMDEDSYTKIPEEFREIIEKYKVVI